MNKRRRRKLETLYARIPNANCKGKCQRACGPITMSEGEHNRIMSATGQTTPKCGANLVCPLLTTEGRCSVYSIRPTICRLFGAAEGLECPFGCEPERVLSRSEAHKILSEVSALSDHNTYSTAPGPLKLFVGFIRGGLGL